MNIRIDAGGIEAEFLLLRPPPGQIIGDLCFGFLPEAKWMTLLKPQKEIP